MNRFLKWLTWIMFFVPAVYTAISWNSLPANIPTHFNLEGKADSYTSKNGFVWMIAVITAVNIAVYLLLCNVYKIDPKRYAAENRERMNKIAVTTSIFLSMVFITIIYAVQQADTAFMPRLVFVFMGPFFSLLGNYMYNIKPNYFAGIRVPWTLEDPENWRKTHQLAGRLWFAGGIIMFITALLCNSAEAAGISMFIIMLPLIIIPVYYSYKMYSNKKNITHS